MKAPHLSKILDSDTFTPIVPYYSHSDMTSYIVIAGYHILTLSDSMLAETKMNRELKTNITILVNDRLHELCKSQRSEIEQLKKIIKRKEDTDIFRDVPFK